jgi:hypothetical protein
MFTPSFTPRGEHSLLKNGGANREFHPQGIASLPGDKIHPWGSKFAPRGEVKNGPLSHQDDLDLSDESNIRGNLKWGKYGLKGTVPT